MSAMHVVPLVLALAISTGVAAQEKPAPNPGPGAAATMPHDCARMMPRQAQGADKGTAAPMGDACPMSAAAPVEKAKAKRGHDHARFHKLM